jgi:hypothetical protein
VTHPAVGLRMLNTSKPHPRTRRRTVLRGGRRPHHAAACHAAHRSPPPGRTRSSDMTTIRSDWIRRRWLGYDSGYAVNMKTAVSMPDDLFRRAEAAARRLRISRSELYAKAIAEFLKGQQGNAITERLDDVYSRNPAKVVSGLHRVQLQSLEKDAW